MVFSPVHPQEEVVVSSAVLPANGIFLGAQTKELGLEKVRAVIPVCSSCRITPSPAWSGWPGPLPHPGGEMGRACKSPWLLQGWWKLFAFQDQPFNHPSHCRKELGERADLRESGVGNLEAFQAACGFPVLDFGCFHFQLSTLFPREAQHNPCRSSGSIYRQLAGHLRSATNNFRFKQKLLVIHSFLL